MTDLDNIFPDLGGVEFKKDFEKNFEYFLVLFKNEPIISVTYGGDGQILCGDWNIEKIHKFFLHKRSLAFMKEKFKNFSEKTICIDSKGLNWNFDISEIQVVKTNVNFKWTTLLLDT